MPSLESVDTHHEWVLALRSLAEVHLRDAVGGHGTLLGRTATDGACFRVGERLARAAVQTAVHELGLGGVLLPAAEPVMYGFSFGSEDGREFVYLEGAVFGAVKLDVGLQNELCARIRRSVVDCI